MASAKLGVFDRLTATRYLLERMTKASYRSIDRLKKTLQDDVFPNAGLRFPKKAAYLGYVVGRLLRVATGLDPVTDRDTYDN
jgi:hypothetical protein